MIKCPLTGSANTIIIYEQEPVPLIQNRVYETEVLAKNATCKKVTLAQSLDNGFVFSAYFTDSKVDYDLHYQNEQSNSEYFREHLNNVIKIMDSNNTINGKVVEIGCGKGYFMNMLLEKNVDISGFDPTYEGDSPKVIKDFFSEKYSDIAADFIILRHTLEHIPTPFDFIKKIASVNNYKGKLYIEVPTFDWIVKHNATEDIFYEHCNYFTLDTLQMFFEKSIGGHFFNGQYIYVIAELKDVKKTIDKKNINPIKVKFKERIAEYKTMISNLKNVAIWGAGAKGSTFLNLTDKEAHNVKCVVDINPKKQHQYIGGTGHYIINPDELHKYEIENMIVMNENYVNEIKSVTDALNINLITL
jgi:2-polyprenyl-3-methyl-5-hydroxy-6-metoxy-1,4-benzoquinol methylase